MMADSGAPADAGQALLAALPEPVPVSALSGDDPSRKPGKNEHWLFDKPYPAVCLLAAAMGCSEREAREGLRALVAGGYVVAPLEPTNAMLVAYLQTYCEPTHASSVLRGAAKARRRWKAMAGAGSAMALSMRYVDPDARFHAQLIAQGAPLDPLPTTMSKER